MKKYIFIISLLGVFIGTNLVAQDIIYLKGSKEEIKAKVIEIGLDGIRYTLYEKTDSPILNIDKLKVQKLVLEDGTEYVFKDPFFDEAMYADQKKNAIKIGFLNPFLGSTQFTYERSLKPGQSIEATLGIIGLGFDPSESNSVGATIKFGYKFIKTPSYMMRGMHYSHLLKGGYVRPEIAMNFYSYDGYSYDNFGNNRTRNSVVSGAIIVNLGHQWVYADVFLIDLYFGLGYGFSNDDGPEGSNFHYGFVGGYEDFPIVISGGFRIGFMIK
jgi:hypothetical protein